MNFIYFAYFFLIVLLIVYLDNLRKISGKSDLALVKSCKYSDGKVI